MDAKGRLQELGDLKKARDLTPDEWRETASLMAQLGQNDQAAEALRRAERARLAFAAAAQPPVRVTAPVQPPKHMPAPDNRSAEDAAVAVLTLLIVGLLAFALSSGRDHGPLPTYLVANCVVAGLVAVSAPLRGGSWARAWCVGSIFSPFVATFYILVATRHTSEDRDALSRLASMVPIALCWGGYLIFGSELLSVLASA